MARLLQQAEKAAKTDASILVLGETGVGKGLLAKTIHALSARHKRKLITVNCGGLPAALVESELFGHERGAFTNAVQRRIGRFERADGSTLFLDEIGDLPLAAQQVLLHILEEDHLMRIGGAASIPVDVRIIAATNRDLYQAVQERMFRADLYQRLKTFPVVLPPLRERREDIPPLAAHFVHQYARKFQQPVLTLSDEALAHLQAYDWPGNVRELAQWVERMVILCEGERLERADVLTAEEMELALASLAAAEPMALEAEEQWQPAEQEEKQRIIAALQRQNWVVSGKQGAARLLGMSPQKLRYRMRKYRIQSPKKS
jgi:transcriptional regulator with GAF, ATPase, and Fis domain